MGPLHGLPISLKDNFKLAGLDSTVGFSSHVGDAAVVDSELAKVLEEAGAVFYVKTNVPTAMMIAETINNVFGRTLNPRNRQTTSGGSSGGESALLVMKGSPIGVGTDIGKTVLQNVLLLVSQTDQKYRRISSSSCCVYWHIYASSIWWPLPRP